MIDCFLPAGAESGAVPVTAVSKADLDGLNARLAPFAAAWVKASGFTAGRRDIALVPADDGGLGEVLFGLGDPEGPRDLLPGHLPANLPPGAYRLAGGFDDPRLAAIAWGLGAYRFERYRGSAREPRRLEMPAGVDANEVTAIVRGVTLARDLVNTPAQDLGPAQLAEAVAALAAEHDAAYAEIVGDALLLEGFPLIYAVGMAAGAGREPRLVEFAWGEEGAPRVTLVGKGVCFDTGGLDIKPPSGMALMKKDMGGAAAVLGLASMIMSARLPVRLRVLVPAVENAIAGNAFRPGDIFRSRKGLTVEIGNTDAEGRLVLADTLAYACESDPGLIIDLATLTGAARVAMGPEVAPFFTDDDDLAAAVMAGGAAEADPVWRLPLWRNYMSMIETPVADINNAGKSGLGGAITAALFLSRFVSKEATWLHGDIYGWNPSGSPGKPEGGEAHAIRALFAAIRQRYPA